MDLKQTTLLGQETIYPDRYNPDLLVAIPRTPLREQLAIGSVLPFIGVDIWNAYELSWLNDQGKPQVAMAELRFPANSPYLVESKSLKLYFNSLNQMHYSNWSEVASLIMNDLQMALQTNVSVKLLPIEQMGYQTIDRQCDFLEGKLLDDIELVMPLKARAILPQREEIEAKGPIMETWVSHLLRSNCPVTGQPDWASVLIRYEGEPIDAQSLLRYIVSLRQEQEFHEHCIERIFMDIMRNCQPDKLTVYGRYTRRGGIDINPWRSNFEDVSRVKNQRLIRQ